MDSSIIDVSAVKVSLREAFLRYREERPNLSLRAISKLSGVNRYFLNKLLDEKDKSSTPIDLNQVLILSKFISEKRSLNDALESSSQEVRETLGKIFNLDYYKQKEIAPRFAHINLYDPDTYFVLVLASFRRGTKREYVRRMLGYRGEQALRRLLRTSAVVVKDGRIFLSEGNEFTVSLEVMKQRIPDYVRAHSFDRAQMRKNFVHVYSEGLNEEAIKKIHKAHLQLQKTIQEVISQEESMGDIPFFSVACMDRLYDIPREDEAPSEETQEEMMAPPKHTLLS